MASDELHGLRALVTGASKGIGYAVARKASGERSSVSGFFRREVCSDRLWQVDRHGVLDRRIGTTLLEWQERTRK